MKQFDMRSINYQCIWIFRKSKIFYSNTRQKCYCEVTLFVCFGSGVTLLVRNRDDILYDYLFQW